MSDNKVVANFKYRKRGKRIAAFAYKEDPEDTITKVFILPCSKDDDFSREKSWEAFNNWMRARDVYFTEMKTSMVQVVKDGKITGVKYGKPEIVKHQCAEPELRFIQGECTAKNLNDLLSRKFKPLRNKTISDYSQQVKQLKRHVAILKGRLFQHEQNM